MKSTTCAVFLIVTLVQNSYQRSTPDSNSYVAGVVQFSPTDPASPNEPPTKSNSAAYVALVEKAATKNVDIVVFPEVGLTSINLPEREQMDSWTTIIPTPSRNYIPCIHSNIPVSETLKNISCSAKDNMIYVVINIAEKAYCGNDTCPGDGRLYYNTNVVFDREGKIIARYRKYNLFYEPQVNITAVPEIVTFDTDFGVTFGTFTCADILYKKPTLYMTRMMNITDFVYPVAWFTSLPFAVPVSIQYGWSYSEDVNLLAAGYSRPKFGNSGAGVYLGRRGIAKAIMPKVLTRELLVVNVPKKNQWSSARRPPYSYSEEETSTLVEEEEEHHVHDELRRRKRSSIETSQFHDELRKKHDVPDKIIGIDDHEDFKVWQDNLTEYKSLPFNSSITEKLCDGDFCCDFDVEVTNVDPDSNYRLIVYDGVTVYQKQDVVGIRVCAVVVCNNDTVNSCVFLQESETNFVSITINATYPNYEDVLILPISSGADLYPLANWTYEEHYDNKMVHVTATLGKPTKNLVTCGLYTRDFSKDQSKHDVAEKNGLIIGMQWATLIALAIVSLFLILLYRKGWRKPWTTENQITSEFGPYQQLRSR